MRIWHPHIYSVLVFFFFAVKNARLTSTSSENGLDLISFDFARLDPNVLNRHLQRLQESLRWIRSPTPKSKPVFRPWGGKRNYDHFLSNPTKLYENDQLCSSSVDNDEKRIDPRCFYVTFNDKTHKRDKFRAWGGKRVKNLAEALPYYESLLSYPNPSAENLIRIALARKDLNNSSLLEYGPASLFSNHLNVVPNDDLMQYLPSRIPDERNLNQNYKIFEDKMLKRQKFYPWGGKRSDDKREKFSPWAGKRSEDKREKFSPWAGKRSEDKREKFSPWAGKRSEDKREKFSPWAGKRSEDKREKFSPWAGKRDGYGNGVADNILNDSFVMKTSEENGEEMHFPVLFANDVLNRNKRSTSEKISASHSQNIEHGKSSGKKVPHLKRRFEKHAIIKRSAESSEIKKMNFLSNFLKKFEGTKERSSSQRFSPWAGRKRAEVVTGDTMGKTIAKRDALDYWLKTRKMQMLQGNRQPFSSWAG